MQIAVTIYGRLICKLSVNRNTVILLIHALYIARVITLLIDSFREFFRASVVNLFVSKLPALMVVNTELTEATT